MTLPDDNDADSVVLRLLCEKAQERLERVWAATEYSHRTVQLPDGTYVWAKETAPPVQMIGGQMHDCGSGVPL